MDVTSLSVGTTAVVAPGAAETLLTLRADPDNTHPIWVGATGAVTAATGYPLLPGDTLPFAHTTDLSWFISTAPAQRLILARASRAPTVVTNQLFTFQALIGTGAGQQVVTGPGVLRGFIFGDALTFAAYNATSGTTNLIFELSSAVNVIGYQGPMDLNFTVGLRIVAQSGKKYTAIWRV